MKPSVLGGGGGLTSARQDQFIVNGEQSDSATVRPLSFRGTDFVRFCWRRGEVNVIGSLRACGLCIARSK